jgi:exopolysaccharide biosynthesis polyprenyl glycosylphosphotransferase
VTRLKSPIGHLITTRSEPAADSPTQGDYDATVPEHVTAIERLADQRIRAIRALNVRGIRLLHLADVAVIYLTLMAITALTSLVPGLNPLANVGSRYWWSYAVIAFLHLAVFYFGGLYDRELRLASRISLPKIVMLVWVSSLLAGLISLMLGEFLLPRSILLIFALVAPIGVAANRWFSRWLQVRTDGPPRVLLVGTKDAVTRARRHVTESGGAVEVAGDTSTVVGLERQVEEVSATNVLLLDSTFLGALYAGSLARLEVRGIGALQVVSPRDSLLGLRNIGEIGGIPYVGLSAHVLPPSQARLKRYMDVVILVLTAPITLLLTGLTALYVLITAGRPLLFVQDRVGRDGVAFSMKKFRTMRPDAEAATGPVQATVADPRIVRGMGWLRQTRLDELPQLWNVAKGEMSIVGPRPERPEEAAAFEKIIPGYRRRHQVPPGITGLAQVYGYYYTDIEYKLGHDLHYLANWSPVLDLQIMARSIWVVLSRRG